jgi:ribosome-binding factor A
MFGRLASFELGRWYSAARLRVAGGQVFFMGKQRDQRDFASRDAGFRGQRLEGLFREELNSLLEAEVNDPRLDDVRVSRVELSRDGSRARVWFLCGREEAVVRQVEAAFENAAGFLRGRLGDALPLKRLPELRFRHDPAALLEPNAFERVP